MRIEKVDIKEFLFKQARDFIKTNKGFPVYTKLEKGQEISKNFHPGTLWYKIDNEEIDRLVCDSEDDEEFYLKLTNGFSPYNIDAVMNKDYEQNDRRTIAPFSRIVELRSAECLELAMIVQLRMQRETQAMVVGVLLQHPEIQFNRAHAINVIYYGDNNPVLVDAAMALFLPDGVTKVPYIANIEAIDDEQIIVSPDRVKKQSYLFRTA
ncbi:MAG TPA: hypothetical protein VJI98_04260 [Candidatus Nanoarchaeia archaeon]|nr:hypothetical protein [Candidatus Nanoarchaeia archaeon]